MNIPARLSLEDPITKKANKYNLEKLEIFHKSSYVICWRFPKYNHELELPEQGFKIHLSATIFNSENIFDIVVPFLLAKRVGFKVVGSNSELLSLNTNLFGYSQVGKFITIYPHDDNDAILLIKDLEEISQGFTSPRIPSDIRIHPCSIVHYRYGRINSSSYNSNIYSHNYITRPDGSEEQDKRDPKLPVPNWIEDPICKHWPNNSHDSSNIKSGLFANRFIILRTLRQRAKGGVYLALDFGDTKRNNSLKTIKRVVLKEARPLGEIETSGVDATHRIKWQAHIQKKLHPLGIAPAIIDLVSVMGNIFLIMEEFGSHSLHEILLDHSFSLMDKIKLIISTTEHLAIMHDMEIYFFDLSPDNIRVENREHVKLVDFEYANAKNSPILDSEVGTVGFYYDLLKTRISSKNDTKSFIYRDIYAIGSLLLAAACPKWYESLKENKLEVDWGSCNFMGELSREIKEIVLKTRPDSTHSYQSMKLLLNELKTLPINKIVANT